MAKAVTQTMDENTRRYYLDAMGIQCWTLIDSSPIDLQQTLATQTDVVTPEDGNRDVAVIDFSGIEKAIQSCTECGLHKTRKQALPGRGDSSARLMFVLLSPNDNDDKDGVICSGEADSLFRKMLAAIDINIDDVYLTSLLKCQVPLNHTITPAEIHSCKIHLQQQIQQIQPKLLVVLGETTARCLLQKDLSIDDSRAMNHARSQRLHALPLFFSYAAEELLQQPANKRKAWQDLQLLKKIINNDIK